MAEILLDRDTRLQLRAQAHGLEPVVLLGANGLTEAVFSICQQEKPDSKRVRFLR